MHNFNYDSATGLAYLESKLAYIEQKAYEVRYKNITYPNIIPVTNEAGPWAESVIYYYTDRVGEAKFIGSKSRDVPIVDVGYQKQIIPVELAGIGYSYSDEEIEQAIRLNIPLPQLRVNAAVRAYEELIQKTSMYGNAEKNLPGFLNNANVTQTTVIDPGSGTEWINKTPDEIVYDINDITSTPFVDTLQIERIDTLGIPTAQWSYISMTKFGFDKTILKYIIENCPFLNSESDIIPMPELAGTGIGGSDRMIAYTKNIDKVVLHIPKPLIFTEPQRSGLGFIVPGSFKIAGVEFRYPRSAIYADGI